MYLCVCDITAVEFFNWALAHRPNKYGKLNTLTITTANNSNENSRLNISMSVQNLMCDRQKKTKEILYNDVNGFWKAMRVLARIGVG